MRVKSLLVIVLMCVALVGLPPSWPDYACAESEGDVYSDSGGGWYKKGRYRIAKSDKPRGLDGILCDEPLKDKGLTFLYALRVSRRSLDGTIQASWLNYRADARMINLPGFKALGIKIPFSDKIDMDSHAGYIGFGPPAAEGNQRSGVYAVSMMWGKPSNDPGAPDDWEEVPDVIQIKIKLVPDDKKDPFADWLNLTGRWASPDGDAVYQFTHQENDQIAATYRASARNLTGTVKGTLTGRTIKATFTNQEQNTRGGGTHDMTVSEDSRTITGTWVNTAPGPGKGKSGQIVLMKID